MDARHLLIFGLGYCGTATALAATAAGVTVTVATRDPGRAPPPGVRLVGFDAASEAIGRASHLLATAAPEDGPAGDPVLAAHGLAIAASPALRWLGYLSTTGVYGDRGGGWVDETTEPRPGSARSRRRLAAEEAWRAVASGRALDLFRLAGIYGPGRSPFAALRAGEGRRVIAPGHCFGRIHRDDIAAAVVAAVGQDRPACVRVLNLNDDEPAETAQVTEEAARLLGVAPPPAVPLDAALRGMSAMARSFWAENRKVSSAATQASLGIAWRYPTYREGLAATLAAELDRPGDTP